MVTITGGLGKLIARETRIIDKVEPNLTLGRSENNIRKKIRG